MSTAKLSIATPVVTMLPGSSGDWEMNASIEDLAQIAQAADRLGYYHLTCSEHIALPAAEPRNRRGPDIRFTGAWNRNARDGGPTRNTSRSCTLTTTPSPRPPPLAPLIEERWRSAAVRPVFAGPMRTMISWEAWP